MRQLYSSLTKDEIILDYTLLPCIIRADSCSDRQYSSDMDLRVKPTENNSLKVQLYYNI